MAAASASLFPLGSVVTKRHGRAYFIALALLTPALPAQSHDFWIEPASFTPGAGRAIAVELKVGEFFTGDSLPRNARATELFATFHDASGPPKSLPGTDGMAPAGQYIGTSDHTVLLAFSGGGGMVELPPERFTPYLLAHGLEWVEAERTTRGEDQQPARERFHRYAKSLLTGRSADAVAGRVVGQKLEIVPDGDPTQEMNPSFTARLLWQGKPLPGCLVIARSHTDPLHPRQARSDADGQFRLDLDQGGIWLLQAVWMERAGWFSRHEWESHWASLTFLKPESQ